MSSASITSLIEALRKHRLLDSKQLAEVGGIQASDPKALAKELIGKGWLTPFQANQLLQGKGHELVLGSYVLLERLGEGGMGEVFKARHSGLGRISAIKVIRKERVDSPSAVKRFQREVRVVAQLNHPNIVVAFDADEIGGTHLLVMEYIDGATDLSKLVKERGPLPVDVACDYIRQAALGLQHAHEHGLVHRDIKPHNLLVYSPSIPVAGGERKGDPGGASSPRRPEEGGIRKGGVVKILDMGLARMDSPMTDDKSSSTLTQEGSVMGTPDYISPEQAKESHTVDIRGDIYSLGCTFYYLLTGRAPFPGGNLGEKLLKHMMDDPVPVENLRREISPSVTTILRKMMAKKPEDRYQTPGEVAKVLATLLNDGFATSDSKTLAETGKSVAVAEQSSGTLDSALKYMAHGGDLAADSGRQVLEAEENRRWLRRGVVAAVLLLVPVAGMLTLHFWPASQTKGDPQRPAIEVEEAQALDKEIINSIGMKLALIPAGEFTMGSPDTEDQRKPDEGPQHKVKITKPFYIGVYEVKQNEYERIMGKHSFSFKDPDNPAENVIWDEAVEFCKKLSELLAEKKAGKVYRLPTEAEWEYACRAGTSTVFHYGDSLSSKQANFHGDHPYGGAEKGPYLGKTVKVGSYKPNAWGLFDMHGNVWEWCLDGPRDHPKEPGKEPIADPKRSEAVGGSRVLRGGAYDAGAFVCRSARRNPYSPAVRSSTVGFRVVCEIRPESLTNSIGMKLALIPTGEFVMGSPDKEEKRDRGEGPQHRVRITKPFYMGVYEVKQSEYEKVMGKNQSARKDSPDHPVEQVIWEEAVEFCKKLSDLPEEKKAGRVYRLPTEAEWEYACRANTTTVFHYGNSLSSKQANFNGDQPYGGAAKGPYLAKTVKVGSYQPNAWGLYDMHGNVWEWCLDGPRPYTANSVDDPKGPEAAGGSRVLRGGSYGNGAFYCRSARRDPFSPSYRMHNVGFRVVCEIRSEPIINSIGMKLALIPAGEFTMGSPDHEAQRGVNEGPQHRVKITKTFYMGAYEVKQSEYEMVMGKNPSQFKDPDNPVEQVNWDEAMEFCKKLSELPEEKRAGRVYRLPTEAEWEYACRANTTTVFHYGNSLSSTQANFKGDEPYGGAAKGPNIGKTTKVGSYKPNAWGLYDMHGNVWEWCLDGPRDYPKERGKEPTMADPKGPEATGGSRLLRGGPYNNAAFDCRSARRAPNSPAYRKINVGFRVVLER